jgi:hypothetical protein
VALEIVVAVIAIFMPDGLDPVESNRRRNSNFSCSASSRSIASYRPSAKYDARYHQHFAIVERKMIFSKTRVANLSQNRRHVFVFQRMRKRAARPTAPIMCQLS